MGNIAGKIRTFKPVDRGQLLQEGVMETPSGIKYTVYGEGKKIKDYKYHARHGTNVSVHYTGILQDGTVFDSSHKTPDEVEKAQFEHHEANVAYDRAEVQKERAEIALEEARVKKAQAKARLKGHPFNFTCGLEKVIKGWDEMVGDMSRGEQRTVLIPPNLAYGEHEVGVIPPNSSLIFKIELVDYNPPLE